MYNLSTKLATGAVPKERDHNTSYAGAPPPPATTHTQTSGRTRLSRQDACLPYALSRRTLCTSQNCATTATDRALVLAAPLPAGACASSNPRKKRASANAPPSARRRSPCAASAAGKSRVSPSQLTTRSISSRQTPAPPPRSRSSGKDLRCHVSCHPCCAECTLVRKRSPSGFVQRSAKTCRGRARHRHCALQSLCKASPLPGAPAHRALVHARPLLHNVHRRVPEPPPLPVPRPGAMRPSRLGLRRWRARDRQNALLPGWGRRADSAPTQVFAMLNGQTLGAQCGRAPARTRPPPRCSRGRRGATRAAAARR